jgi:hypothetical protein
MSKAYVETTILTDLLLKPKSPKQHRAEEALKRYDETLLPVYSIKEWKAGPLDHFAYLHDKLVFTRSFADTLTAISALSSFSRRRLTADEAVAAAAQTIKRRPNQFTVLGNNDSAQADSYRLALVSIILRSWKKRRQVTSSVVDELPCYVEAAPRIGNDGFFDLTPKLCEREDECSLASALKAEPEKLKALRRAIPEGSNRTEDIKRRQALKRLIKRPEEPLTRDFCRDLGDAVFAFFCPKDAVVLTTNISDHEPLAEAVGKRAEKP